MKLLILIFYISSIFSSQIIEPKKGDRSSIFIYHSGKAMVNENRELIIDQNGELELNIVGLPSQLVDTGIQINADNYKLNTFSIARNLITEKALLSHFIGNKIQLQNLENNTMIDATLISFKGNTAVYGTEKGVIVNPSLKPIFPYIPENLKDEISIHVFGNGNIGNSILNLSYFTERMSWGTEYHLILNDEDKATLSANYQILNKTDKSFPLSEIFLIADKNIESQPINYRAMTKVATVESNDNLAYQPSAIDIDDVMIYKIPTKMSLKKDTGLYSSFISPIQLPLKKQYIALHVPKYFDKGRRNHSKYSLNPTDIYIELKSNKKLKFHLPKGIINIYEYRAGQKMFIGNKSIPKTSQGNPIQFQFKKSHDILHSFSQIGFEENNKGYSITIQAVFKNLRDENSEIIWKEKPGRITEIVQSSIDFVVENVFELNAKIILESGETRKETLTLFIPKRD